MNRILAILFTVLGFAFATAVYAIDYPTYKGPTNQRVSSSGGVYSTADQAIYGDQMEQGKQATFNSTSPYSKQMDPNTYRAVNTMVPAGQYNREYSVPVSALSVSGGITTEDQEDAQPGVRRVRHRPTDEGEPAVPAEPGSPLPVGDAPWLFMLLMAAAYAAFAYRRRQA